MHLPFRIPVSMPQPGVVEGWWESQREEAVPSLRRRATANDLTTVAVGAVVGGLILLCAAVLAVRILRSRHPNPKYIPTPFLKRLWSEWKVPAYNTHQPLPDDDRTDGASTIRSSRMRETQAEFEASSTEIQTRLNNRNRNNRNSAARSTTTDTGVDRNTSVRSVMTLPAYRPSASNEEQVLGIEGERDGIDVVVEMPTAEEEEAMRDDEMEALYQIRLARRRQIAEREERRRLRQEARDRNDLVALQELRTQALAAGETNTGEIGELRQEHERIKETRQRAVSSVSYADVGIARADGTRVRANSTESSERVGLLSDAASIAVSTLSAAPRSPSGSSLFHHRERSASSVLSIDTSHSDRPGSPALGTAGSAYSVVGHGPRSRANSRPETPRASTRAGSSPEIIDAEVDLGDTDMPPHSPPGYDDVSLDDLTPSHPRSRATSPYPEPPPDYPGGPTQARNDRLSAHMADLVAGTSSTLAPEGERRSHQRQTSRGVGGVPQLPSLRLGRLPQIVIEPSSALPRDSER